MSQSQQQGSTGRKIPQEIHDTIIRYVRLGHEEGENKTCSTCLVRDLAAYSMVCKSWHRAVLPHL